jgi:hypothetical protein
MKFLLKFWNYLTSFWPKGPLLFDEPTTRYLFAKRDFVVSKNEVKSSAFMPEKPPRELETSIQRIKGLKEFRIWIMGHEVGKVSNRKLLARADIMVADITRTGLKVSPDPWPSKHAVIIGWPAYEAGKSEQMNMANKLALTAKLRLPEDITRKVS